MQRVMLFVLCVLLAAWVCRGARFAQAAMTGTSKVFRLDGGNVTYAFGVNSRGELQQLYWGGRLAANGSCAGGGSEAGGSLV